MFPSAIATSVLLALSLVLQPTSVGAGLIYYNGPSCNQGSSAVLPCDGSCQTFRGQSFYVRHFTTLMLSESRTANACQQVQPGSGLHCVTLYPDDGCPTGLEELIEHSRDAQCTNVNSGIVPRSFRCSESNLCISS